MDSSIAEVCRIEGCGGKIKIQIRKLCGAHFEKFRKYGDPLGSPPPRSKVSDGICSVSDCNKRITCKSVCVGHYRRILLYGSATGQPGVRAKKVCAVKGCIKPHHARGFCAAHESRFEKRQDMNAPIKAQEAHRKSGSRAYNIWTMIKKRCYNPKTPQYGDWGGRGIQMCSAIKSSFTAFLDLMGEPPVGTSIDRKNVDGNYSCGRCEECTLRGWPLNMRWATRSVQSHNKRCKGVHRTPYNTFTSYVKKDGQRYYLGTFSTEEEAIAAYRAKSLELYGE